VYHRRSAAQDLHGNNYVTYGSGTHAYGFETAENEIKLTSYTATHIYSTANHF